MNYRTERNTTLKFAHFLRGMVIGVANIIPGVSGGTLALVLGIFDRLIGAIHKISLQTLLTTLGLLKFNKTNREKFRAELARIDAYFLITVFAGAILSIGLLAKLMTYFLEHFHDPTYGFFWGLVIISAWVPLKLIKKHTPISVIAGFIAIISLVGLTYSIPDETKVTREQIKYEIGLQKNDTQHGGVTEKQADHSLRYLLFMIFSGAVGISAMILPGISGSFLLLLLGAYFPILQAITDLDIITIAAFSAGCLIGVLTFTRLINFLLKKWYDVTTSFLVGLVIGSLVAIWPFKNSATVGNEIVYLSNKLPASFGTNEIMTILAALAGGFIVWLFIAIESKRCLEKV